jgi:hypothetical protein
MRLAMSLAVFVIIVVTRPSAAEPAITGSVLSRFVGSWTVTGTTMGKPTVTAARVLAEFGGAFLELHVKDPSGKSTYEARVFFGREKDGSLIVHWLDATGGETSRTLGTGRIDGDLVTLNFPYPDGMFRDRLSYDRAHDRWRLWIEMGPTDNPETFSDWDFSRIALH